MDRRRAEPALLALLAIAAIAAAAATLPSVADPGGGGSGSGPVDSGQGDRGLIPTPEPGRFPVIDFPDLGPLLVVLGALGLLLLVAYAILNRRELLRAIVGLFVLMVLLYVLFWLGQFFDPSPPGFDAPGDFVLREPAGSEGTRTTAPRPLVLLIVVGVVVAGVVAMAFRAGTGDDREDGPVREAPDPEAIALGEAAGRAADRIEETADLDNEIYRAWREMTELLDVPAPGTSTPGEFATAAVEAGMDREAVDELTRLFEDVRYGGDEPTETSEQRALAVLRRIESTYSEAGT